AAVAVGAAEIRCPGRNGLRRPGAGHASGAGHRGDAEAAGHSRSRRDRGRARKTGRSARQRGDRRVSGRRHRSSGPHLLFWIRAGQRAQRPARTGARTVKTTLSLLVVLMLAAPAAAQQAGDVPPLSIRPFVLRPLESFAASETFDAVFGRTYQPFFGGGVQVLVDGTYFVELSASRFKDTGQRAFISGGQAFPLGIPLTATFTPFE